MADTFFIDVDYCQKECHAKVICGDVFLKRKITAEDRTVVVLSDGLGSGVKANILASMTASMALNFVSMNATASHTADIIMSTLPMDRERKVSFCSFTIIDIEPNGFMHIVEYGNPEVICLRKSTKVPLDRTEIKIRNRQKLKQKLYYSEFLGKKEDRLVICSDGVTQSGIGSKKYPLGWGRKNVSAYIKGEVEHSPTMSSLELSKKLIFKSLGNDALKAKDDITAGVVYLREPRKLMLCSGPPYDENKDWMLATNLDGFKGTKVICGGTTATIIARVLNRKITTPVNNHKSELPPVSKIDNIDLVTEGILTIGRAQKMLEEGTGTVENPISAAARLCNLLLAHDEISFVVGTKVNEAHQDPALPVELEIRRNVIKKMAAILNDAYLKKTTIEYI